MTTEVETVAKTEPVSAAAEDTMAAAAATKMAAEVALEAVESMAVAAEMEWIATARGNVHISSGYGSQWRPVEVSIYVRWVAEAMNDERWDGG